MIPRASYSLCHIAHSLFPIPCFLFPTPCPSFPVPSFLFHIAPAEENAKVTQFLQGAIQAQAQKQKLQNGERDDSCVEEVALEDLD